MPCEEDSRCGRCSWVVHVGQIRSISASGPCPSEIQPFSGAHYTGTGYSLTQTTAATSALVRRLARLQIHSVVNNSGSRWDLYGAIRFIRACEGIAPTAELPELTFRYQVLAVRSAKAVPSTDDTCPPGNLAPGMAVDTASAYLRDFNTVSPVDVIRRIEDGEGEFLLFALTPPRLATDRNRVQEIADLTVARLAPLDLDGLILYDIDDETERNPTERPFPFAPTLDPADYLVNHLAAWPTPVIVYRAVGKYAPGDLRSWLSAQDPGKLMTVLVGAASRNVRPRTSLADAQALAREVKPALSFGGVAIPERHSRREDEHLRLLAKQDAGCRFFVTQVVYDINAAKNLVSDYHYECKARGVAQAPFVFTFSVCGSMKTLDFLRWLGVDVPRWIENDLKHAADPLEASYHQALTTATELMAYCRALGVPSGINVESVSIRRVEIEASVRLAQALRAQLGS